MLAVLHGVKQLSRGDRTVYVFKFVDGNDLEISAGSVIDLTGYEIDAVGGDLTTADTLLEAIGKLEKRIYDIENP